MATFMQILASLLYVSDLYIFSSLQFVFIVATFSETQNIMAMNKLTTLNQIEMLRVGDILKKFPSKGDPQETFDEERAENTDTYVIRSTNTGTQMIELVMTGASTYMFASPGEVGRLFIKSYELVEQKIWWI